MGAGGIVAASVSGGIGLEEGLKLTAELAELRFLTSNSTDQLTLDAVLIDAPKLSLVDAEKGDVATSEQSIRQLLTGLNLDATGLTPRWQGPTDTPASLEAIHENFSTIVDRDGNLVPNDISDEFFDIVERRNKTQRN